MSEVYFAGNPQCADRVDIGLAYRRPGFPWPPRTIVEAASPLSLVCQVLIAPACRELRLGYTADQVKKCSQEPAMLRKVAQRAGLQRTGCGGRRLPPCSVRLKHFKGCPDLTWIARGPSKCYISRLAAVRRDGCVESLLLPRTDVRTRGLKPCQ
jgi:hypothetical protein